MGGGEGERARREWKAEEEEDDGPVGIVRDGMYA